MPLLYWLSYGFLQFFICKSSVTTRLDIGKHILFYIGTYIDLKLNFTNPQVVVQNMYHV